MVSEEFLPINAKSYILCPISSPKDSVRLGDNRMCGNSGLTYSQLMMTEARVVLEDSDIIGIAGINTETCLVMLSLTLEECLLLERGATISADMVFKKNPSWIPSGGVFLVQ